MQETFRETHTFIKSKDSPVSDFDMIKNMIKNSVTLEKEIKPHLLDNTETIHYMLCNKWKCKDGTILQSRYRHDYVSYVDSDGTYYFVDGGLDYIRHSGNMEPICVYTNDPHDLIRENFTWISYGINGDEGPYCDLLKGLTKEHIDAILLTQKHLPGHIKNVFINELQYRINIRSKQWNQHN